MGIAAIPTLYNGIQFRSRLEAKWAAFFDLLGLKWSYEPIDMNGWIPDFRIGNMLVDVKPARERPEDTVNKIDDAVGDERVWTAIVGESPEPYQLMPFLLRVGWMTCIGELVLVPVLRENNKEGPDIKWELAAIHDWSAGECEDQRLSAIGIDVFDDDRMRARHLQLADIAIGGSVIAMKKWSAACNETQWKKPMVGSIQ